MKNISEIKYNRYLYYLACPVCENVYFDDVPMDERNKWCECGHKLIGICADNKKLEENEVLEEMRKEIEKKKGAILQYDNIV